MHTAKGCVRKAVEQLGDMTGSADCNADPKTGGDFNGCSTIDEEGSLGSRACASSRSEHLVDW